MSLHRVSDLKPSPGERNTYTKTVPAFEEFSLEVKAKQVEQVDEDDTIWEESHIVLTSEGRGRGGSN